jgi:hypothetical protein
MSCAAQLLKLLSLSPLTGGVRERAQVWACLGIFEQKFGQKFEHRLHCASTRLDPVSETGGGNTESNTEASMSEAEASDPRRKNLRPAWPKGVSGNPNGRPRIEPRVRRYARRYDRRMCKVLAEIAQDTKLPAAERRRAAMDLVSIGSGRPALVQEITGRDGEQLAPLVSLNFPQPGQPLTPEAAYAAMIRGELEPDPHHPAFRSQRPPIEGEAAPAAPAAANAPTEEAELAAARYGSPAGPAPARPLREVGAGAYRSALACRWPQACQGFLSPESL